MLKKIILVTAIVLLVSLLTAGEIPKTINYQGLLTDSGTGEPVPDNYYMLTFRIYNGSSVQLWTSYNQTVEVINGRFNYLLGSSNPIPDSAFDEPERWLGITIDSDPEITPRTELTSNAYSYRAKKAYGLSADSAETDYLKVGGINEDGIFRLYTYPGDQYVIHSGFDGYGGFTNYSGMVSAAAGAYIGANESGGNIRLYRNNGSQLSISLEANHYDLGEPRLSVIGNGDSVVIDLNENDDESVRLPFRSISDLEMFNEPGVGNDENTSATPVTLGTSFTTICYKSMIFPDDGYVVVTATGGFGTTHTNGITSSFSFGVSMSGSSIPAGMEFDWYRSISYPTGSIYDIVTVQGYFEVTSGLNSFYFLGKRHSGSLTTTVHEAQMNIMYFPTNYEFELKDN